MNIQSTPPLPAMNSNTLYWVTKERRQERESRIREIFVKEMALGYLMAAIDFEWTIRRAIVLMNTCPTAILKKALEVKRVSGLSTYCECWTKYVQAIRKDTTPNVLAIIFDSPQAVVPTNDKFKSLQEAMALRHRLVHGVSGGIPVEKGKECFERLLSASKKISEYVDAHADKCMQKRVVRRQERCHTCKMKGCCPLLKDIEHKEFQCNRKAKCPFVSSNGKY